MVARGYRHFWMYRADRARTVFNEITVTIDRLIVNFLFRLERSTRASLVVKNKCTEFDTTQFRLIVQVKINDFCL